MDVRLRPDGQLSGFAKGRDLEYFLREIRGMKGAKYVHLPVLAPSDEMLDAYRKEHRDWETYERDFLALMAERRIEKMRIRRIVDNGCLLCSEPTPHYCHRRLVAEYLEQHWGGIEIVHL